MFLLKSTKSTSTCSTKMYCQHIQHHQQIQQNQQICVYSVRQHQQINNVNIFNISTKFWVFIFVEIIILAGFVDVDQHIFQKKIFVVFVCWFCWLCWKNVLILKSTYFFFHSVVFVDFNKNSHTFLLKSTKS
jgi:hypothetical protein